MILIRRELTLLSPATWDDKNDRLFMEAFARANKLTTSLALCFSEASETYHHWKIFAPGTAGVRIDFDKNDLLRALPKRGFLHGPVDYPTLPKFVGKQEVDRKRLPFLKRRAFQDEKEYRIVFGSRTETLQSKSIPIDLGTITGVYLSPWIPVSLYEATRDVIARIEGCEELDIYRSSLLDHQILRRFADRYA